MTSRSRLQSRQGGWWIFIDEDDERGWLTQMTRCHQRGGTLVHVGSRWFMFVHVCSRLFTLVHVCSRWFTFVHVGSV